jgi:hypothetical protein
MKRWLPHIGIVLGIAIAVYALFFSSSDEDIIRDKLAQLEQAVRVSGGDTNVVIRAAKVRKEFSEIFETQVTIEIPELTSVTSGRTELVQLAASTPQLYRTASVDLGGLSVDVDQAGTSAVAYGEAVLTGTAQSGELRRDERTVSLRFDKIEGDWLIVQLSVSAAGGDAVEHAE